MKSFNLSASGTKASRILLLGISAFLYLGSMAFANQAGDANTSETGVIIWNVDESHPFNFQRIVGGILTKQGCNATNCHGGIKGRGGFKLSINALHPADDYEWIVKGGTYRVLTDEVAGERKPRVNVERPEESLLLLKPTLGLEHEGGKRLHKNSPEYAALLEWIRGGALYTAEKAKHLKIEKLEIIPQEIALEQKSNQQLKITARLANGQREDVTRQARFESNNREVVKISTGGLIEAAGLGETDIIVRAAGCETSTRVGVIAQTVANYPDVSSNNFIDDFIFRKLRKFHVLPSDLADDSEFLRRVCLDITGTLPPPERVREFLGSKETGKRDRLIELLLSSPQYIDYWTFQFADLFRVGPGQNAAAEMAAYWSWLRDSVAQNKSWDQLARERIAAEGYGAGPSVFISALDKNSTMGKLMSENTRLFMGRRFDCSQCHNHPFEVWSQDQYWGMAAFYARLTTTDWTNDRMAYDDPEGQEVNWGEKGEETLKFVRAIQPRSKKLMTPTFLDKTELAKDQRGAPRKALAEWTVAHPFFAEAMVNRMWSYLFGRGLVNPIDDFKSSNPPTHPDLLAALARDLREHGHDLKHLIRVIVQSRTYQLASFPNQSNKTDAINYSHSLSRPVAAEVLLDMIAHATGIPVKFDRDAYHLPVGTRAIQLKFPAAWPSQFLEAYGRPYRQTLGERSGEPVLMQSLHMLVGNTYTDRLAEKGGRIDTLVQRGLSNRAILEELYLAGLSRFPSEREVAGLEKMMGKISPVAINPFFTANAERRAMLEDILWAMVCSREFAYNH